MSQPGLKSIARQPCWLPVFLAGTPWILSEVSDLLMRLVAAARIPVHNSWDLLNLSHQLPVQRSPAFSITFTLVHSNQ
jgi:hypothetical protein